MILTEDVDVDNERLEVLTRNYFYSMVVLTAVALFSLPLQIAGRLLGMMVIALISYSAANFANAGDDEWERALQVISVSAFLVAVVFLAYHAFLMVLV